jgi:hypothetical protein
MGKIPIFRLIFDKPNYFGQVFVGFLKKIGESSISSLTDYSTSTMIGEAELPAPEIMFGYGHVWIWLGLCSSIFLEARCFGVLLV